MAQPQFDIHAIVDAKTLHELISKAENNQLTLISITTVNSNAPSGEPQRTRVGPKAFVRDYARRHKFFNISECAKAGQAAGLQKDSVYQTTSILARRGELKRYAPGMYEHSVYVANKRTPWNKGKKNNSTATDTILHIIKDKQNGDPEHNVPLAAIREAAAIAHIKPGVTNLALTTLIEKKLIVRPEEDSYRLAPCAQEP